MLKERTRGSIERHDNEVCGMMRRKRMLADLTTTGRRALTAMALAGGFVALAGGIAHATTIKNPIAVFAALDKVTGRISHLEVPIDQTVEFGALKVTPRVCDSRPPTETPHTAAFVEVDEIKLTGEEQRLFTGWMFAESPGLHAVEHPDFDVWLTSCKTPPGETPPESAENEPAVEAAEPTPDAAAPAAPPPPAAAAPAPGSPPPPPAAAPALPWLTPSAPSRRR
ncbi:MAG: DUF2155 domain-containing protein [Methyloceanibacter sp.]